MALPDRHGLDEAAADQPSHAWISRARSALKPWRFGESYSDLIPEADPARPRAAYTPAVWERLRATRARWDPDGVFAAGHVIALP